MSPGEKLRGLDAGDRVRVLGWVETAARQFDAVARVDAVERHAADGDAASVSVTLVPMGGPARDFADVLPDGVETAGRLDLYAARDADGDWPRTEVWTRDASGATTVVGTVQHLTVL